MRPTLAGVDLEKKAEDVARLAWTIHGRACKRAGVPWDEFLSELYLTILRRNGMDSAFNPRRASLARYVAIVGRTVLSHMQVAQWRHDRRHTIGARDASGETVDAALVARSMPAPAEPERIEAKASELAGAQRLAARIERAVALLLLGYKTKEAAEAIGAPREVISWIREEIRAAAGGVK